MWFQVRKILRSSARHRDPRFAATGFLWLALVFAGGCASSKPIGSIGVLLGRHKHTGALHVRGVPAGLTGSRAGLESGDRIKMIDGLLVDRMSPERVRELLRGPEGSTVMLTVLRGDRVLHLKVTRDKLVPKSAASSKRVE